MILPAPLLVPWLCSGRGRAGCWVQIAKAAISGCARPARFEGAILAVQIYLARTFVYRRAPGGIAKCMAGGNIERHCRNYCGSRNRKAHDDFHGVTLHLRSHGSFIPGINPAAARYSYEETKKKPGRRPEPSLSPYEGIDLYQHREQASMCRAAAIDYGEPPASFT